MKKKVGLAEILAILLVLGSVLVGCDNGTTPNGGNGNNNSNGGGYSVPSAPSSVTATALSSSSIRISWSSVSNADGYEIRYEVGNSTEKNYLTTVSSTSYTHTGLLPNTTYYYYILKSPDFYDNRTY
jgi:hypothetical protein